MEDDARAHAEKAHPRTAEDANGSAPPSTSPPTTTTTTATSAAGSNPSAPQPQQRPGHELPFVAPSSYLRPKPISRTMSDYKTSGPLDKEQMQGLVSIHPIHPSTHPFFDLLSISSIRTWYMACPVHPSVCSPSWEPAPLLVALMTSPVQRLRCGVPTESWVLAGPGYSNSRQ